MRQNRASNHLPVYRKNKTYQFGISVVHTKTVIHLYFGSAMLIIKSSVNRNVENASQCVH